LIWPPLLLVRQRSLPLLHTNNSKEIGSKIRIYKTDIYKSVIDGNRQSILNTIKIFL
jgi:hypothetical protein